MGSFSPTIANNPTTQNRGKGGSIGSGPRGDFGDPNFDNAEPMPYQFRGMADRLMGDQFYPNEDGGMSGQPANMMAPAVMPNTQYQQPMGKGGRQTNSATSGQPRMGMRNQYPNTVGQWDNSQIQPLPSKSAGKAKGG